MKITNHMTAVMIADKKARETGKQQVVVQNKKTGLYSIKLATAKKLVSERIIYFSR